MEIQTLIRWNRVLLKTAKRNIILSEKKQLIISSKLYSTVNIYKKHKHAKLNNLFMCIIRLLSCKKK